MSLKSSPGGQSFSFSTIGCPSSDLRRSAKDRQTSFTLHVISCLTMLCLVYLDCKLLRAGNLSYTCIFHKNNGPWSQFGLIGTTITCKQTKFWLIKKRREQSERDATPPKQRLRDPFNLLNPTLQNFSGPEMWTFLTHSALLSFQWGQRALPLISMAAELGQY